MQGGEKWLICGGAPAFLCYFMAHHFLIGIILLQIYLRKLTKQLKCKPSLSDLVEDIKYTFQFIGTVND